MRYCAEISYLGSAFCGWQVQPNGYTVQEAIGTALQRLFHKKTDVTGCSRTDSGVHARQYFCHFDADTNLPAERIAAALQFYTPKEIAVLKVTPMADDFHARYSCTGKNYIYRLLNAPVQDPFEIGRAWWVKYALDTEKMNEAAKAFLGTHDFSAFCAANTSVEDKVRTVRECAVKDCQNHTLEISITADGFLYNMVRIIAGTLVSVGTNEIRAQDIPEIIESKKRAYAGITAPACGLYLNKVYYN